MSKISARILSSLIALSLITVWHPSVYAQTQNTGAIQGRVFEVGSLAPLPDAVVTITNEQIEYSRTTLTDKDGTYLVQILPAGTYRIVAQKQGYENDSDPRNSTITNFLIHITNTERADQPPPIALRKTTTATAPAPTPPTTPTPPRTESDVALLANTTNATRGQNFDERFLLSLPLPGVRTFDDLAFLAPGVAPPPLAIGINVGPGIGPGVGTSGQFSVNGLRSRSNNFTIDGSDNNDEEVGVRRQGFTSLVPQSIESVQEFQISTLLAEPQYGRNMGAQVNAVSRSGSSHYHGTAYGFLTDKRLRARDPFDFEGGPASFPITRSVANGSLESVADGAPVSFNGLPLAPANPVAGENAYTRGMYGFVLGGPVVPSKTFVFFSFEHQDINASKESHFAVPTIAQRGLFKSGDVGLLDVTDGKETPTFPTSLTGDSFFSLFPFPNNPIGPYGPNTFTEVLPANADGSIFSVKLDHNFKALGKDHNLSGRYNFTDDNTILPVTGEALFSSLRALVRTQNFALSLNSSFSGRSANQFRFSFGRTRLAFEEVRDPFLLPSKRFPDVPFLLNAPLVENLTLLDGPPRLASPAGFDTESAFDVDSGTGPLGQLLVSGFSPVGVDVFNFPQGRANNLFQYADTFIYNINKHRLVMGADIRRSQLNSFQDRNFRPVAVFSAAADLSANKLTRELNDLGSVFDPATNQGFYLGKDFLAVGAPSGFLQTLALFPDSTIGMRYWQNDFFFSDQIRVRSNFMLTVGLRYELNTVPKEVNRRIESTFGSPEVQQFIDIEKAIVINGISPGSGLERLLGDRKDIYQLDTNNLAPHIAFAWDPFGHGRTSIRAGYGIYYDQILGAVISQSRNVFPSFLTIDFAGGETNDVTRDHTLVSFNPTRTAAPGTLNTYDSVANPDIVSFLVQKEIATSFVTAPGFVLPANDLVTPYAQHWGLTIEQQVKKDLLFSAAYVGTKGVHLLRTTTPNLGHNAIPVVNEIVGSDNGIPRFNGFIVPPNTAFAPQPGLLTNLRPFPLLGSITILDSDSNSDYHALQLQAIKRFSNGFQFTAAYTYSHAIDEVSDIFDLAGGLSLPQDSFDRRAERGNANFDVRHRFVYSAIWDLPIFEKSKLLGGWQLASIGTFQSGQPYSVLFCCDVNLDGNLTERAGATGRNQFRAPKIANVDFTVNKYFRFNESRRAEFRTEFFNLFNHPNFGIPIHQLYFASLTSEPLTQQLFTNTVLPARTIQFAFKFTF
jgi:Carboxypeptidase regulatory-like domain